jgi:hypothetical protein
MMRVWSARIIHRDLIKFGWGAHIELSDLPGGLHQRIGQNFGDVLGADSGKMVHLVAATRT